MNITILQQRLAPLLRPVGAVYGALMRVRATRYAEGKSAVFRAARPVVSVGNISWGGTGKTPLTEYLLDTVAARGLRAAVLTRGYKAHPPVLPYPVRPDDIPARAGDEPLMLARRHPEALVVADPVRARAAAWAEANDAPDIFILDDGMQHLAIRRDLDIVLLTPNDLASGWNKVIPAGTWREDASALARAGAFCVKINGNVTNAADVNPDAAGPDLGAGLAADLGADLGAGLGADLEDAARARLSGFGRPVFFFFLEPVGLVRLVPPGVSAPDGVSAVPLALERGPYSLACGTGNPDQVRATVAAFMGREPERALVMPDHHAYTPADATTLAGWGHPVICTAKDAVKLAALLPAFGETPVWTLEVKARFGPSLFTTQTFDAWWADRLSTLVPDRCIL